MEYFNDFYCNEKVASGETFRLTIDSETSEVYVVAIIAERKTGTSFESSTERSKLTLAEFKRSYPNRFAKLEEKFKKWGFLNIEKEPEAS